MMVADFVFLMLATVLVVSGVMVITTRNPIQSVLWLVLAFFTSAGLFVLIEAEFIAAILVMVYMGAVAILFLFVVMMLDVDFAELRKGAIDHLPMGLMVGLVVLVELAAVGGAYHLEAPVAAAADYDNTLAIGKILYTKYLFPFELASVVLLVALIGAIALTHRERKDVKKQRVSHQLNRKREDALVINKVKSGEGA
ncbi:NADH-quinone oxidoreductase subunit J [Magnetofaba australis]|uniref:NADH-quinone oxidoreductase subunit J n=1 Tax=Magnetofaba australis IT-1 TaxID=1434232 RepID=A0A1Y2K7Q8_9PROT|nr:NADH-quinone oxidoreductase subunit J [Magnetofaba australis]OSM06225.1 putative NADH-ubiquinone/plastoquinone oxidoreductase, chain 6 [Magnetofaba australis IT-1]